MATLDTARLSHLAQGRSRLHAVERARDTHAATRRVLEEERAGLLREKAIHEETLDRVPVAQELLQALYDQSSGALIRSCEQAMTDAVQGVIGDESRIGIDAEISSNQIKVSIGTVVDLKGGGRVLRDIVSNEGGGLTNVVCTSLRAIALVRSGQRRFMVLDESNCYLNPSQLPPYMRVIRDLASRAGFQIILLTHHGIEQFDDDPDVNVITLTPTGHDARLHATHRAAIDVPGILTSIELENFGAHASLTVPLVAGLNIITGPSNVGKSRIIAALRAAIAGMGSAGDIRTAETGDGWMAMEKAAVVRITFDGGKVLEWVRRKSGSPTESWSLTMPGATSPATVGGIVCSGRNGMTWVGRPDVMNMNAIGGLWPALHLQHFPVFALDNPKALAALIAVSKTSVHLQAMIAAVSERKRVAMSEIRRIDQRLDALSKLLFLLENRLAPIERLIDDMTADLRAIEAWIADLESADLWIAAADRRDRQIALGRQAQALSITGPDLPDVPGAFDLLEAYDGAALDQWIGEASATLVVEVPDLVEGLGDAVAIVDRARTATRIIARAEDSRACVVVAPVLPDTAGMTDMVQRHDAMAIDLWAAENAAAIAGTISAAQDCDREGPVLAAEMIQRTRRQTATRDAGRRATAIARGIVLPDMADHASLSHARPMAQSFQQARQSATEMARNLAAARTEEAAGIAAIETLRRESGICPTCGQSGHNHADHNS